MNIDWEVANDLINYDDAIQFMESKIESIRHHKSNEFIWMLEHENIYTAGTSADKSDIIGNITEPIYNSGRGGKYTYHGPGQRIIYLMLNLKLRFNDLDLRQYIDNLEEWIIISLKSIGIDSFKRSGRVGIWVNNNGEKKIAAIGVRVRKYITYHGIAININPDLSYYDKIIACGIKDYGITSIKDLGYDCRVDMLDEILKNNFYKIFK